MINELALFAHCSFRQKLNRVNSVQFSYIAPYVPSRHLVSRRGDIGAVWRTEQN